MREPKTSFTVDCGNGFNFQQSNLHSYDSKQIITGSFHRLTPEQFDALVDVFGGEEIKTLTTDGKYNSRVKTFRTTDIDFGGLNLTLFSDVEVNADQLAPELDKS